MSGDAGFNMNPFEDQGCQFSDFNLISDFLRLKETSIQVIKYSQNMDILIVSKDMIDISIIHTVSKHVNQFRLSSD